MPLSAGCKEGCSVRDAAHRPARQGRARAPLTGFPHTPFECLNDVIPHYPGRCIPLLHTGAGLPHRSAGCKFKIGASTGPGPADGLRGRLCGACLCLHLPVRGAPFLQGTGNTGLGPTPRPQDRAPTSLSASATTVLTHQSGHSLGHWGPARQRVDVGAPCHPHTCAVCAPWKRRRWRRVTREAAGPRPHVSQMGKLRLRGRAGR